MKKQTPWQIQEVNYALLAMRECKTPAEISKDLFKLYGTNRTRSAIVGVVRREIEAQKDGRTIRRRGRPAQMLPIKSAPSQPRAPEVPEFSNEDLEAGRELARYAENIL